MKKMMARSLMVALGASIFLYSEHIFANTVIYDPLDPQNTITPVPNDDPEPSDYLIDGEVTMESTAPSSSEEQRTNGILGNTLNNESQNNAVQIESQSVALLPENRLEQEEKTNDLLTPEPYLPKLKARQKHQVLMLDDDFFSPMKTTVLPRIVAVVQAALLMILRISRKAHIYYQVSSYMAKPTGN